MDAAFARLIQCLDTIYNPTTPNDARTAEYAVLDKFKASNPPDVARIAFELIARPDLPLHSRFFGAQALSHIIKVVLAPVDDAHSAIADICTQTCALLASPALDLATSGQPAKVLATRLVAVLLDGAKAVWPTHWPTLLADVSALSATGPTGALAAMTFINDLTDAAFNATPSLTPARRLQLTDALDDSLEDELLPAIVRTACAALVLAGVDSSAFAAAVPAANAPGSELLARLASAASAPWLVSALVSASASALGAAAPCTTPATLRESGAWAVLQALLLEPVTSVAANATAAALLSRRIKRASMFGAEFVELWQTVLRLLTLSSAPEARNNLGRGAQTRILCAALRTATLLVRDCHDALTVLPRTGSGAGDGGALLESVVTNTLGAALALAEFDSRRVVLEAGELALAVAEARLLVNHTGAPAQALRTALPPLVALTLRLASRLPVRPRDAEESDDEDEGCFDAEEETARDLQWERNGRATAGRLCMALAATTPSGLLAAFMQETGRAVVDFQVRNM